MSLRILGGNLPIVKQQNRVAVLNVLHRFGPLSRRQISGIIRLTPATITNIVGELLESGLAMEVGSRHDPAGSGAGRRQVMVDLRPEGAFAVGVHLGVRSVQLALGDVKGRLLSRSSFAVKVGDDPDAVLQATSGAISSLLAESPVDRARVLGVGVGCAALVDPAAGVLRSMLPHGWRDVPVAEQLGSALRLPVAVENNRNAMAIAESTLGLAQTVGDFALLQVGTTVGASVVIDHRVHHGGNNAAGQIGHLVLDPEGPLCSCGLRGCLDTLASERAMVARAMRVGAGLPDSSPLRRLAARSGQLEPVDVFAAAMEGDEAARAIVSDAASFLGTAVGHLMRILSPELIILVGKIFGTGDLAMEPLRKAAFADAACLLGVPTRIVPTGFGPDLMVIGGVALALNRFLYSPEPGGITH